MFRGFRVGFFDYDRCLYVHDYPAAGEPHASYYDECIRMLMHQDEIHKRDKPLNSMKWAIHNMQDNGAVCYVLTHEIFNLRDERKRQSAMRDYGIEHYLAVDTPDHKIDMMLAVAKMHNVSPGECLFVDDKISMIYKACASGICGKHVSNIYSLYEEYVLHTT